MYAGNKKLSEVLSCLGAGKVHLRAILSREESGWVLRYIEIVVGVIPPAWRDLSWVYKEVAFLQTTSEASSLIQSFREALQQDSDACISEMNIKIPKLQDHSLGQWRPSKAQRLPERFPWPTSDWAISSENSVNTSWYTSGILTADNCPTFINTQEAIHAFQSGKFSTSISATLNGFGIIQIINRHAWIHKVNVEATAINIWIKGDSIRNTVVQLIDSSGYKSRKVGSTGRLRISYAKNLADDARLFLTDGSECLDYRVLGLQHPYSDDSRQNVEYEAIDDPDSEITRLITQGEGSALEYKRELPSNPEEKRKLVRTVAAFANGQGGEIVFGMDPNEATVVGLFGIDHVSERDRLTNIVRDLVTPCPLTDTRLYEFESKILIVLSVARGNQPPYGRLIKDSKVAEYYIRRGANTYPARPDEIREIVLYKSSQLNS